MLDCKCDLCRSACWANPGWFLPDEARAAIAAGLAPRMMRDWLEPSSKLGNTKRIYVLAPAAEHCGGRDAPEIDSLAFFTMLLGTPFKKGRCVLLDDAEMCSIHDSGFKPFQCRSALLCDETAPRGRDAADSNYSVARAWNTDLGRAVVEEWRRALGTVPLPDQSLS